MPHAERQPSPPRARRLGPLRPMLAAALLGVAAGAAFTGARELLPAEGAVARGVRIGGTAVARGQGAREAAEAAARRALDRRITLTWGEERLLDASLAELGAEV